VGLSLSNIDNKSNRTKLGKGKGFWVDTRRWVHTECKSGQEGRKSFKKEQLLIPR